jgi:hypothetical protein
MKPTPKPLTEDQQYYFEHIEDLLRSNPNLDEHFRDEVIYSLACLQDACEFPDEL